MGSFRYLATTATTDGEFGLYRVDMKPAAGGPSTHFHRTISESFFILSGTLLLFDGARWIDATAGDFLYVPVGGLHAFRNDADEPASMLLLFAPGPRARATSKVCPTSDGSARTSGRGSSSSTTTTSSPSSTARPTMRSTAAARRR